jgi:hypothetical protein
MLAALEGTEALSPSLVKDLGDPLIADQVHAPATTRHHKTEALRFRQRTKVIEAGLT